MHSHVQDVPTDEGTAPLKDSAADGDVLGDALSPTPTSPSVLRPQHLMAPDVNSAHVCKPPSEIAVAVSPDPMLTVPPARGEHTHPQKPPQTSQKQSVRGTH
jgi:hypothetical protein